MVFRYLRRTLTPTEAKAIYDKAKAAVDEYNTAKADGTITQEEKLRIAEKVLITLETIVKDLE